MSERNPFVAQSREEVVKSTVNWSLSKQLWTIPKKRRFQIIKPQCPHAFYQQNMSGLSHIKIKFTSSQRKLFTQNSQSPSPADYFITKEKSSKEISFGVSREQYKFRSYVEAQHVKNPAPTNYDKYASENSERAKRGFTIRPKTANDHNYFVENKELQRVPGPSDYDCQINKKGQCKMAKFKSVTLGGAGLMKKSKRFQTSLSKTPGPSQYDPFKTARSGSAGFRIGNTSRTSFIDEVTNTKSPGPGDYLLPSQFGHYNKTKPRTKFATIS